MKKLHSAKGTGMLTSAWGSRKLEQSQIRDEVQWLFRCNPHLNHLLAASLETESLKFNQSAYLDFTSGGCFGVVFGAKRKD